MNLYVMFSFSPLVFVMHHDLGRRVSGPPGASWVSSREQVKLVCNDSKMQVRAEVHWQSCVMPGHGQLPFSCFPNHTHKKEVFHQ